MEGKTQRQRAGGWAWQEKYRIDPPGVKTTRRGVKNPLFQQLHLRKNIFVAGEGRHTEGAASRQEPVSSEGSTSCLGNTPLQLETDRFAGAQRPWPRTIHQNGCRPSPPRRPQGSLRQFRARLDDDAVRKTRVVHYILSLAFPALDQEASRKHVPANERPAGFHHFRHHPVAFASHDLFPPCAPPEFIAGAPSQHQPPVGDAASPHTLRSVTSSLSSHIQHRFSHAAASSIASLGGDPQPQNPAARGKSAPYQKSRSVPCENFLTLGRSKPG